MREQVEVLLKLRRLDDALDRLAALVSARQADLQRRQTEADLVRQALERERQRLKDAGSQRREADLEVQTFRERKTHFEKQMTAVKTNEEFLALQREIATMEKKAREWEDIVLEAMEAEEAAQHNISQLEVDFGAKDAVVRQERARVATEREVAGREVGEINQQRGDLVAALTGAVRAKYERLRGAKPDAVIVTVRDGSCGGCHYRMPPQMINEVRQGQRMVLCESCGRILVWVPEGSDV